jgi:hypothetical protein
LNLKEVEIEKMNKTISTQSEEIKNKDKVIGEYHKLKYKMLIDMGKIKNKLSGKPYLLGAKHIIWDEIISEVGKIWDYFKIIDDEILLIDEENGTKNKSFHELGTRPQLATQMIKFLNLSSKETLENKGIKDRTAMVMKTEKVFTKRNLIQQAQNKCIMVKRNIESFTNKFENLVKMGLPSAWDDKGKFFSYENYKKKIFIAREKEDKFQGTVGTLRGQSLRFRSRLRL